MEKTLRLLAGGFESSSYTTPEFATYASTFKREVKKRLTEIGAELLDFSRGHFYVSGFFKKGDQIYYFSQSDVRWSVDDKILVRTAKHVKDYTGGASNYSELGADLFERLPTA